MGYSRELGKAERAVKGAGDIIRNRRGIHRVKKESKEDGTPVTEVDRAAEKFIRDYLGDAFPDYGFLGEEFPPNDPDSDQVWLCDPIDGTWSYINGETTASVSLALKNGEEETVLGAVYNPFTDELYSGAKGVASRINDFEIPRYESEDLTGCVVNHHLPKSCREMIEYLYEIYDEGGFAKLVKQGGSIAYNLSEVAEGRHKSLVSYMGRSADPWDVAAGIYLIESVGGKVTDLEGQNIDETGHDLMIASTNEEIHGQMLERLREKDFGYEEYLFSDKFF